MEHRSNVGIVCPILVSEIADCGEISDDGLTRLCRVEQGSVMKVADPRKGRGS